MWGVLQADASAPGWWGQEALKQGVGLLLSWVPAAARPLPAHPTSLGGHWGLQANPHLQCQGFQVTAQQQACDQVRGCHS